MATGGTQLCIQRLLKDIGAPAYRSWGLEVGVCKGPVDVVGVATLGWRTRNEMDEGCQAVDHHTEELDEHDQPKDDQEGQACKVKRGYI